MRTSSIQVRYVAASYVRSLIGTAQTRALKQRATLPHPMTANSSRSARATIHPDAEPPVPSGSVLPDSSFSFHPSNNAPSFLAVQAGAAAVTHDASMLSFHSLGRQFEASPNDQNEDGLTTANAGNTEGADAMLVDSDVRRRGEHSSNEEQDVVPDADIRASAPLNTETEAAHNEDSPATANAGNMERDDGMHVDPIRRTEAEGDHGSQPAVERRRSPHSHSEEEANEVCQNSAGAEEKTHSSPIANHTRHRICSPKQRYSPGGKGYQGNLVQFLS